MEGSSGFMGEMKKGTWSALEDQILRNYIEAHGEGNWRNIPINAGLRRCRKSCRLRWLNYLKPDIRRGNITPDEVDLILKLHKLLGNKWSLIAGRLPGRTDNEIKNYWNTKLAKKSKSFRLPTRNNRLVLREKVTEDVLPPFSSIKEDEGSRNSVLVVPRVHRLSIEYQYGAVKETEKRLSVDVISSEKPSISRCSNLIIPQARRLPLHYKYRGAEDIEDTLPTKGNDIQLPSATSEAEENFWADIIDDFLAHESEEVKLTLPVQLNVKAATSSHNGDKNNYMEEEESEGFVQWMQLFMSSVVGDPEPEAPSNTNPLSYFP